MARPRRERRVEALEKVGLDRSYHNTVPTTYSLPDAPLPDAAATEAELAAGFSVEFPRIAALWPRVLTLHRTLIEHRAKLLDDSLLRASLELLAAKGITDARAAQVLIERGYVLGSLGPLRGAGEAADLMEYFLANSPEAEAWFSGNPRFDNLGWVRQQLRNNPEPLYHLVSPAMHGNPQFTGPLLARQAGALDTHYEIIPGPWRNRLTEVFSGTAAFEALRVVRTLHEHRPEVVGAIWAEELTACVAESNRLGALARSEEEKVLELRKMVADSVRAARQREGTPSNQ